MRSLFSSTAESSSGVIRLRPKEPNAAMATGAVKEEIKASGLVAYGQAFGGRPPTWTRSSPAAGERARGETRASSCGALLTTPEAPDYLVAIGPTIPRSIRWEAPHAVPSVPAR